jgi:hypothetical protein
MAIEQYDIASTLRFMGDPELRQYAAMHKNDPYIFPLAFQESQNRQKLRMSQQGVQGMQPQPKVADQALAQMMPQQPRPMAQAMPEDQGIGALDAPNMKFGAEGGIMGYEGYDEGPSTFGQEPVMMMAEGGVARYQSGGNIFDQFDQQKAAQLEQLNGQLAIIEPQLRAAAASNDQQAIQMYSQQAQGIRNQINTVRESAGNRLDRIEGPRTPPTAPSPRAAPAMPTGQFNRMAGAEQVSLPSATAGQGAQQQAQYIRQQDRLMAGRGPRRQGDEFETEEKMAADRAAAPPVAEPAPKAASKTTPKADTERKDPSAKTDTGGLDSLINKYTRAIDLGIGANKNARVALAADVEQIPKTRAERNAEERKKEGDVFAGREARLAEREKGIAGMGDKYMGLALLQAGAAMMSTPGNIGSVLGKGIAVGSERYIAGIDKINAAKDKFAEARDRLEDLRLNRADMTKKEIREDQRAIDDGVLQAKKLLVDGATNDLKISTDAQTKIFGAVTDNLKTDKLLAGRLAETNILAAARGDTAGTKQARLQLDSLKAQAANISNELKDPMLGLPRNAALKQAKQAELARINTQMNQIAGLSTMMPASPAGASSGVQFLGYE